jgi:formate/nitrite transporter FocA (FNT family)
VGLHPLLVIVKGALCGVTITAALMCHLKEQTWMSIVYVMVFILAGFEHSIANACFIISSRVFTLDTLYLFLLSALGNTIGSVIFYRTGVEK